MESVPESRGDEPSDLEEMMVEIIPGRLSGRWFKDEILKLSRRCEIAAYKGRIEKAAAALGTTPYTNNNYIYLEQIRATENASRQK